MNAHKYSLEVRSIKKPLAGYERVDFFPPVGSEPGKGREGRERGRRKKKKKRSCPKEVTTL